MTDPAEIYLSPPCCSDMVGEGRLWCENDEWPEGDCGTPEEHRPATRYVRADLAHAEMVEVLREAEELLRHAPEAIHTAFLAGIEEREGGSARRQEKFMVPSETLRRKIPSAIMRISALLAKAGGGRGRQ